MDQVKEFLRQAIKYRFWIAVGLSVLLPLIGFFAGKGKIQAEALREKNKVDSTTKALSKFTTGPAKNAQWSNAVKDKTGELNQGVNVAWRKLYDRQAPLLTWPTTAEEPLPFREWGKKWPEGVDPAVVGLAVATYADNYATFVDEVYATFHPWIPETGTGVVVARSKEELLQPAQFNPTDLPTDLGQIWSTQEKLWVQRALLEVIAKVNKKAKTWDTAVIKQLDRLDVANPEALDQFTVATAEDAPLTTPEPIVSPEAKSATEGEEEAAPTGGRGEGGGAAAAAGDAVQYLASSNEQYQTVPICMTVLIDQNYVNDLLVELANSPMSIQVVDCSQQRPSARVEKPTMGMSPNFGYGMRGMMGRGDADMFNPRGGGFAGMGGMFGMRGNRNMFQRGRGALTKPLHGQSLRGRDLRKEAEAQKKAAEQIVGVQIHDPYYYIMEVTVFGHARFYNAPPAEEPSTAADADEPKADAPAADADADEAKPKADATKGAAEPDAKPKAIPKAEPKADADEPKADAGPAEVEPPAAKPAAAPKA